MVIRMMMLLRRRRGRRRGRRRRMVACNDCAVALSGEYDFIAKGGAGEQEGAGHLR
jgi:hypothetical protein